MLFLFPFFLEYPKFLDVGDAEGGLIILRVLLEELTGDYDGEMDYNGD